jgi:beta-fructofuranosidase
MTAFPRCSTPASCPRSSVCATGSPDLVTWTKPAHNPVIDGPPAWLRAAVQRAISATLLSGGPDDGWHLIIASHIANVGGCVLHYRSPDLVQWEYLGVLLNGDAQVSAPVWTGTIWECPNLLDFGEQQALIISTQGRPNDLLYAFYHTGCLHAGVFRRRPAAHPGPRPCR